MRSRDIPQTEWEAFRKRYISDDISELAQGLITTLILIIPEAKVASFEKGVLLSALQADYYNLLIRFTDVNISRPQEIEICIETKEVFDTRYKASWYNFFR